MIRETLVIAGVVLLCSINGRAAFAQTPNSAQSEAGEPRARTVDPVQGGAKAADKTADKAPDKAPDKAADRAADKRVDRVELDTTTVTGNQELPKVMYVVPWKKSDIGDLVGKPINSLLDEVLAPVDRDVFRREVTYYNAVNAGAGQNTAKPPSPSHQGEK